MYTTRADCRLCHGALETIYEFGPLALTSVFPKPGEDAPRVPMTWSRCENCGLVQLAETTNPLWLYTKDYGYKSGTNEAMRQHLTEVVARLLPMTTVQDTVLDIGCNDGTLLKAWPKDVRRVGFDPIAEPVEGCEIVADYFSAGKWVNGPANVVTSLSMFYDLDDPVRFAREVAQVLASDGVWVIEVGYLGGLFRGAWDAICHEHLTYWTVTHFVKLAWRAGLRVFDVRFNDVNGGSVQVWLDKKVRDVRPSVAACVASESTWDAALFTELSKRIAQWAGVLKNIVAGLKGRTMALGASTKGNFTLQVCGLDSSIIVAAGERSPHKWGRRTPGTDIPIISEADMRAAHPDYLLVLPWHFRDGLMKREQGLRDEGTQFVFPLPTVEIV